MNFARLHHKALSLVVLVAFAVLVQGYSAPAHAAAKASEETAVERGGDAAPGSFEKQGDEGFVAKKKKKFPWLLAGLGIVAIGIVVYLLAKKTKSCTLTVTLGPGVVGSPHITGKYKKREAVQYSYTRKQGYGTPWVTLDGIEVQNTGTITMDRDHVLMTGSAVIPPDKAILLVNSRPAGARIFLDKVDSGYVTPHAFSFSAPGKKYILLRHDCGYTDWGIVLPVKLGRETLVNNASLNPGIYEYFDVELSPCWLPRNPANWSLGAGVLSAVNTTGGYEFAGHRYYLPGDFTCDVELRCLQGMERGAMGVIVSTSADPLTSRGYEFALIGTDKYVIYKNYDYSPAKGRGYRKYVKEPTYCWYRSWAAGAWDRIIVVKSGANYAFYVNGEHVFSFRDDDNWDIHHMALGIFGEGMKVDYNSVSLTKGNSGWKVPGQPFAEIPVEAGIRDSVR